MGEGDRYDATRKAFGGRRGGTLARREPFSLTPHALSNRSRRTTYPPTPVHNKRKEFKDIFKGDGCR